MAQMDEIIPDGRQAWLSYILNTMAADVMATQGSGASEALSISLVLLKYTYSCFSAIWDYLPLLWCLEQ